MGWTKTMGSARAHIPEGLSEERPNAAAAQGLGASALRSWLNTMLPAITAPRAASAAGEARHGYRGGTTEIPTAHQPVFPGLPRPDGEPPVEPDQDLEQLCDRLDGLTRQLTRLVTRMDSDRSTATAGGATADPVEAAIAEIFARQRMLAQAEPDGPTMFPPAASFPVVDPAMDAVAPPSVDVERESHGSTFDLGGLEQQLKTITKQLEILRSPCRAEELVADLRQELAGIASTLEVLVPRSAFDALKQEVHALGERLDFTRDTSADVASFAKLEQGLADIHVAIRDLAPVELGEAVRTLSHKVDQITVTGADPVTLQQLDNATNSLRSIVTQVASGDALAALVNEVRELGEKINSSLPGVSETPPMSLDHGLLVALEREVSGIAATLNAKADQVPAPAIEPLIESIAQKLDRFDLFADDGTVFAPINAHISELGDKIDRLQTPQADPALASLDAQFGQLAEKIESLQSLQSDPAALEPLQAQLGHLTDSIERMSVQGTEQPALAALDERMRAIALKLDRLEANPPERTDIGPLERRIAELAEKLGASETRLGNLEAIEHGMTELLARLDEIRTAAGVDAQPSAPAPDLLGATDPSAGQAPDQTLPAFEPHHPAFAPEPPTAFSPEPPPAFVSEYQAFVPEPQAVDLDGPRGSGLDDFFGGGSAADEAQIESDRAREHAFADPWPASSPRVEPVDGAEPGAFSTPVETMLPAGPPPEMVETPAEQPNLPLDAPIEPGSGPPRFRAGRSTAERIAASQAMLGPVPADRTEGAGPRPNFIVAARRAAQAASEQHEQAISEAGAAEAVSGKVRKALTKRMRSLFVTGSAIVLALAATGITLSLSDWLGVGRDKVIELALAPEPPKTIPQRPADTAASWMPVEPSSPNDLPAAQDEESAADAADAADNAASVAPAGEGRPPQPEQLAAVSSMDTTGSLGTSRDTGSAQVPPAQPLAATNHDKSWSDPLPPVFRTKALIAGIEAQNPGAAYEIAVRYAEGQGVNVDMAAAAAWFARAAEGGLAPAQFRLGGMYEKGIGVKKDLEQAHRFYLAAADRGNAHAMHNIAVLYAEGADGKPDFASALKWFRKAAEHGVADSQYNAAVLLARGIGVEQNTGEAYKWFAVAAKGGDTDAAKKRDEIGERLDAQTLAAARLAASMFTPTPQPEDATTVRAPASGWDDVAVPPSRPHSGAHRRRSKSARL